MYSSRLLDHFQNPRNAGELKEADARVALENPACGDVMELAWRVRDGRIDEIRFRTRGCVAAIACGGIHSLAIKKSDSTGLAWGLNNDGQLGVGTTDAFLPNPTPLASGAALTAIAAGAFHSLAIRSGGAPLAWGYNATGQLGDGTTANRLSPVSPLAPADGNVTGIAAGWAHSLFVR